MMTLTSLLRRASRQALVPALLVLVAFAAVLTLLVAGPASATEAEQTPASTEAPSEGGTGEAVPGEGEGAAEEGGKLTISDNPHDQFGLVLVGLGGLAAAAMLANAVKQLKGQRPAADGRIRWR